MSNVLLCFLGKGPYQSVRYAMNDRETAQPEKYFQAALVQLLDAQELHVRLLATEEARTTHVQPLTDRLRELGLDDKRLRVVDIEDPTSETALWAIFEKVLENIAEDDHVWFDITHGFRALPVAAVLALTFARNVKKFTFERLVYGAFEARDQDTNIAPVFDLTAMLTLPAWSESLAEWKRTGRSDGLVQQTKPYLSQVKRQSKRITALTDIPDALQRLLDALTMVRHDVPGNLAERTAKRLEEAEAELPNHPSMKPLGFILGSLKRDIEELRGDPRYDPNTQQEKAAVIDDTYLRRLVKTGKWFLERKRVVEGTTILRETITACAVRLVRHGGVDEVTEDDKRYSWHHEKFRANVDWGLQVLSGVERRPEKFDPGSPRNKVISAKLANNELREAACAALKGIRASRNKLNHAWTSGEHTRESFNGATEFIQRLQHAADDVDRLVELTIAATTDA